jgi:chemotaxis protein methyltransferase CheR
MHDLTHVRFQGVRQVRPAQAPRRLTVPPEKTLGPLATDVLARAGLDPQVYRPLPLARRVSACLRALDVASESDGIRRLRQRPDLLPAALDALLIGVSEFFRDPPVFDAVRTSVLPSLAGRRTRLRIWSVGCSTGAELYSAAILLAEAGLLAGAELLGTDCRAQAIASAREGVFEADALKTVGRVLGPRYFDSVPAGFRVTGAVRASVTWQVADATGELPKGLFDLVFCRNLVIYLQPAAVARLFQGIASRLAPGGFLVVGKAERAPQGLGLTAAGRGIYRRADV